MGCYLHGCSQYVFFGQGFQRFMSLLDLSLIPLEQTGKSQDCKAVGTSRLYNIGEKDIVALNSLRTLCCIRLCWATRQRREKKNIFIGKCKVCKIRYFTDYKF